MLTTIRAIYESDGVLRLPGPLPLNAGQAVEVTLNVPTGGAGPLVGADPAFDLASLAVDGGPPDLAHEHNYYLYGTPKQGVIHDG